MPTLQKKKTTKKRKQTREINDAILLDIDRLNNGSRLSRTIGETELKKESRKAQFKRLQGHRWGLGLEHEVQFFHHPTEKMVKSKKKLVDYIIYNADKAVKEIYNTDLIDINERKFLAKVPLEPTGRKCAGQTVLKKTPVPMPEFVSENPFSLLSSKGSGEKREIEYYVKQIIDFETKFMDIINRNPLTKKQVSKYGPLYQYPFGMTSYLKYPKKYTENYVFPKKDGRDMVHQDYLGSYHLTITLPYTNKTSLHDFVECHRNFANQVQWLEPLLVTAFFSSDQRAVGTTLRRIKGSWRITRIGWGNLAGSDVRKLESGIGRYGNIVSYWREDFDFYGVKKAEICEDLSPKLKKVEPGAKTGYSSNFRTFGSTDPDRPWHRESGAGMTKPNGVELRIFDHFSSRHLIHLGRLIIYIAENSRKHKATKYVYENAHWIKATQDIMLNGWHAQVSNEYVKLLREQIGLPIRTKSRVAYEVLKQIAKELYQKGKKGDWTYLMISDLNKDISEGLPDINRRSWDIAFMLKMNREAGVLKSYNDFTKEFMNTKMMGKTISAAQFKKMFYTYFDSKMWARDITNIMYFFDGVQIARLIRSDNGIIEKMVVNPAKYKYEKIENWNEQINNIWDTTGKNEDFIKRFQ